MKTHLECNDRRQTKINVSMVITEMIEHINTDSAQFIYRYMMKRSKHKSLSIQGDLDARLISNVTCVHKINQPNKHTSIE
jgi:hypothetical protein